LLLLCHVAHAQAYKFRQLGVDKGLCHHSVYAVEQDKYGFVWFATGLGLCRYDGFQFESPKNTSHKNATTIFKDADKNLWFGFDDGTVLKYDGDEFLVAYADSMYQTSVKQMIQTSDGAILAATQTDGITRIEGKNITRFSKGLEDKALYSICLSGANLLLGCSDGLYLCGYESKPFTLHPFSKIEDTGDNAILFILPEPGTDNCWVFTEDNGLYHLTTSGGALRAQQIDIPDLQAVRLQSMYEDDEKNLWVCTMGNGLYRIRFSPDYTVESIRHFNSNNGLGSDYIRQVFFDSQHTLWVGTYGQGVACLSDLSLSFWEQLNMIDNNATAVLSASHSEHWFAGNGALVKISPNEEPLVFNSRNGVPNCLITALYKDVEGDIWIGTEKLGIYKLNKNSKEVTPYYFSDNSLSNIVQAITSLDHLILAATMNGVLVINPKNHSVKILNTYNGLPHNKIRDIYTDSRQNVWIATNSNSILTINQWIDPQQQEQRLFTGQTSETEFACITEDANGNIWAGTKGAGLFLFDRSKDTVIRFSAQDGMKSDFCYALAKDDYNHVWAGHRLGLSRIDINRHGITTFGTEYGITGDVNFNALTVNSDNELIAGLTKGVMLYQLSEEVTQHHQPILNLTAVTVGDSTCLPHRSLSLPFARHRIRFDFIGLQYDNPEAVKYQYMLQGFDTGWSDYDHNRSVLYPRLENGEYTLLVKACNGDNCTEVTPLFSLTIRKPYWKTWWFIFLMAGVVIGVFYSIIVIRERVHKQQQEYLERELDARTQEVHEQKEEIEAKNKDITDSINYAQRIQFSVLPSTQILLNRCSDAFILYRPRDIVSGDFYWFDYFPKTECILAVCADSTGHGVPGAFMSLIGTTLIKDIVMRPDVHSPDEVLLRLDESIQSTLNQNQESEQSNDGMDIIVCEINVKTCHVRISSAMRPFVIYRNGVKEVYKGAHCAIGGHILNNKNFELIELDLAKGDSIYMFSDGYPDQFGGPAGKKFKMNRLLSILDDIQGRDMSEQHRVLLENFDLWKGTVEQVDDVLMIGIKL
jgi:ligand-binding sensor domain-containing protein/serine phosphatase RsbU (regulator of sigma subunit)